MHGWLVLKFVCQLAFVVSLPKIIFQHFPFVYEIHRNRPQPRIKKGAHLLKTAAFSVYECTNHATAGIIIYMANSNEFIYVYCIYIIHSFCC